MRTRGTRPVAAGNGTALQPRFFASAYSRLSIRRATSGLMPARSDPTLCSRPVSLLQQPIGGAQRCFASSGWASPCHELPAKRTKAVKPKPAGRRRTGFGEMRCRGFRHFRLMGCFVHCHRNAETRVRSCQRVCTQDRSIPAEWRRRREHIRIICGAIFPTDKSGWARGNHRLVSQPIVQQAYFSVANRKLFSFHDFQTGLGYFDNIGHARFKFCLLTLGQANIRPRGRCHRARR